MRFRPASLLGVLLLLSVILASLPAPSKLRTSGSTSESSSISGRVAGVSENQLTLSVGRNQTLNTLNFTLTSNTKIEGALVVGAQATIDYRVEGKQLIATHIVVTVASGMSPY